MSHALIDLCQVGSHTVGRPEYDFFEGCSNDDKAEARAIIIDCVLATDLKHHPAVIMEFKQSLSELDGTAEFDHSAGIPIASKLVSSELKAATIKLVVKCADISNPARPWGLYAKWVPLILREFYSQGDQERERGLPISPFMDREHQSTNKTQIGFIKYVVKPLYDLVIKIAPRASEAHECLVANLERFQRRVHDGDDSAIPEDPHIA
jgi:hypothetical protein